MILVCQTLVVRPVCAGVASAVTLVPTLAAPTKLVLLSIVVVPLAPDGSVRKAPMAADRIRERHHSAAVQRAAGRAEIRADDEFRHDALGRCFDDLHADSFCERDDVYVEQLKMSPELQITRKSVPRPAATSITPIALWPRAPLSEKNHVERISLALTTK